MMHRGVAAVAVITLAVGIGSSVTMFGAMDALMLRPLPLPDAGRLVEVYGVNRERGWDYTGQSIPNLVDFRARSRTMHVVGFRSVGYTLSGIDYPERLAGYSVSWDFFNVLEIRPALGRSFTEHEERAGASRVAVISHGFWRRRFASDPGILERVLVLDGEAYAIIGVLPSDFWFRGQEREVWTALKTTGGEDRGADVLHLLARLEPGATLERAREEASEIALELAVTYPETNRGWGAGVRSFREHVVPVELRSGGLVCLVAVALLLLIVCANVTNLLLSRVSGRMQEMAVRAAIGASPARLARHLLTEALVLSALGGVGGVLLALWGIEGVVALLPAWIPTLGEVGVDLKVLLFALAASVLTAVLVGTAPAIRTAQLGLSTQLPQARGSSAGPKGNRLSRCIVVAEVSLAVVLLVS
ncbi:MAG: ABC transporter permease, partial [Gemmatimonadota bacterium]